MNLTHLRNKLDRENSKEKKSLQAEIARRKLLQALQKEKRPSSILRPIKDNIPNMFFK